MKTKFWFISAGLSGALALSLPAQTPPAATAPAAPTAHRAAAPKAAPVISLEEAQQKVATAPVRYPAHPTPPSSATAAAPAEPAAATKPDFVIATPPPAPRPETKPAAPAANLVWVPGHYMPVKGQWVWVAGEWSTPATPSSVWIPARYETAEKSWTPGYWQPDRPASTDPNAPASEAADGNPVYR